MTIEIIEFNPSIEILNRKIDGQIIQIMHRNRGRFRVPRTGEHDLGQSDDGSIIHRLEVRSDGTGVYKSLPQPGREEFAIVDSYEDGQDGTPQKTGSSQVIEQVLSRPGQYVVIGGSLDFGRTLRIQKIIRFRK